MAALQLILTDLGRAKLVAAQAGGTNAIRIVEAGISPVSFVPAPTLTFLPGEIKRVDTVAGIAAAADTVHLTIRDDSAAVYDARGVGLYLDDGSLFAFYVQPDPIVGKVAVSTFFLAADLKFVAGQANLVQFGQTNFLNPPATESVRGVTYLATIAEALAGAVADKIITPATLLAVLQSYVAADELGQPGGVATLGADGKLLVSQRPPIDLIDVFAVASEAAMLALAATAGDFAVRSDNGRVYVLQQTPATSLGNWLEISTPAPVSSVNGHVGAVVLNAGDVGAVPTGRSVTGGGLVTGGGGLDANRQLVVTAATPEEASAGGRTDRALTPASIAPILTMIAGKAAATATIGGSGLVKGGGPLSDNPVLQVLVASAAEILAGAADDRAVTPLGLAGLPKSLTPNGYCYLPGGLILQWVQYRAVVNGEPVIYINFPTSFPTAYLCGVATAYLSYPSASRDLWTQIVAPYAGGCAIQFQADDANDRRAEGFDLFLIGY